MHCCLCQAANHPHHAPQHHAPQHHSSQHYAGRPPANGLGIAGFIVSLVGGLLTCGFLAPLGLLLSAAGLFRPRRGLAIAGTILGGLGTAWLIAGGMAVRAGIEEIESAGRHEQSLVALDLAAEAIEAARIRGGELPTDADGRKSLVDRLDGYGRPIYYRRLNDRAYEVRSSGRDGVYFTDDDLTGGSLSTQVDVAGN